MNAGTEVSIMMADVKSEEVERDSCHVRVWSGECEHTTYESLGDKYRCNFCEAVFELNHEVRPAAMPYVSGDYSTLS
jgi:hypothetical protein